MRDRVHLRLGGVTRLAQMRMRGGAQHMLIDVDGCLTDGSIYIDDSGSKLLKVFGPDDHDAIDYVARHTSMLITLVTADLNGLGISAARARHFRLPLAYVDTRERMSLPIDYRRTVYMGDGWYDGIVMQEAGFGITPVDAYPRTRRQADAYTSRPGGRRAVAQAIEFVIDHLI